MKRVGSWGPSAPVVESSALSILYLRFIELFAFFGIVFAARFLGDFTYRTNVLIGLFLAAAFLQYNGEWLWEAAGARFGWDKNRRNAALLWYSSYVDLAAVIALIHCTGTVESPFLFMLTIPLFFVCNTFSWKVTSAYFVSASLISLGVIGYLEMHGTIGHYTVYHASPGVYLNPHYLAGSLLVIGAFVSLVIYLSNAFQDRMSTSLERMRKKREESESRANELSRLYDISTGINAAISLETLLKIVAKEATLLLERPWASIVLFNQKQEVTHSVFVGVNQNRELKLEKKMRRGGLSEWIWTHNTPIVVEDATRDKRANCSEFLGHFGIRSIVGFPLTSGKQVMGIVFTGDFAARPMSESHMRLLTTLCQQLSVAIEKSRLYDSLERKIRELERQLDTLEKTNILKSDFVSHVSHELRTPLTSIKAYVEALVDNQDDPRFIQRKEFLDIISKETDRLIRMVNNVLDVSKIEFGQPPPDAHRRRPRCGGRRRPRHAEPVPARRSVRLVAERPATTCRASTATTTSSSRCSSISSRTRSSTRRAGRRSRWRRAKKRSRSWCRSRTKASAFRRTRSAASSRSSSASARRRSPRWRDSVWGSRSSRTSSSSTAAPSRREPRRRGQHVHVHAPEGALLQRPLGYLFEVDRRARGDPGDVPARRAASSPRCSRRRSSRSCSSTRQDRNSSSRWPTARRSVVANTRARVGQRHRRQGGGDGRAALSSRTSRRATSRARRTARSTRRSRS